MSVRDSTLHMAALKLLGEAVGDAAKASRADGFEMLKNHWRESGSRTLDVLLPDGTKVATISLTFSKGGVKVIDQAAFEAWAAGRYPQTVVMVPTIPDAVRDGLLRSLVVRDGEAYTEDGEQVPGIAVEDPSAEPVNYSVKLTDREPLRAALGSMSLPKMLGAAHGE